MEIAYHVSRQMQSSLFDLQTAGGLFISISPSRTEALQIEIDGAAIIGKVHPGVDLLIHVY
jgi:hypothetical protein